jgi:hypothetical protein
VALLLYAKPDDERTLTPAQFRGGRNGMDEKPPSHQIIGTLKTVFFYGVALS